jgi:hypothetical protein
MKNLVFILLTALICSGFTAHDVPKLCRDSSSKRMLELNRDLWKFSPDFLNGASPQEIAGALLKFHGQPLELAPWLLQDPSRPNLTMAAYMVQLKLAQRLVHQHFPQKTIEQVLTEAAAKPGRYSPRAIEQARGIITFIRSQPKIPGVDELKKKAVWLCAGYGDLKCPAALRQIADTMDPRIFDAGVSVSMVELTRFIFCRVRRTSA